MTCIFKKTYYESVVQAVRPAHTYAHLLSRWTHISWNLKVDIIPAKNILCTKHVGTTLWETWRKDSTSNLSELSPVGRVSLCLLKFFLVVSATELEVIANNYESSSWFCWLNKAFQSWRKGFWVLICWLQVELPLKKHKCLPPSWNWPSVQCAVLNGLPWRGSNGPLKPWSTDEWK